MSRAVADAAERLQAIDPLGSFCVSAPAGSGKTELLIQRFLGLLARVERPEAILAITFTRKAAAEMRARILEALYHAAELPEPSDPHRQLTWRLGRAALDRDTEQGWRIRENPGRLVVRTIDSFCAMLTRRLPVLSGFGSGINVVDDAVPAYREATLGLLNLLASRHELATDIGQVLLRFDGDWSRLQRLLISMLKCRDQWLVHMGRGLDARVAQRVLEESVAMVVRDTLERGADALGDALPGLWDLYAYSREQLGLQSPGGKPGLDPGSLPHWRGLVSILLKADNEWRQSIDKRAGFPAGDASQKARKTELIAIIEGLKGRHGLRRLLEDIRYLPGSEEDDWHWQLLLSVSRLLPMLAAQLAVAFQRRGEVDHIQVSMAALEALGDEGQATDLAQAMDYRLQHILVDEFQDTAVTQYALIQRLTRGWLEDNATDPGNPRTLFIVGDGMQSIYGFRNTDVGLFARARDSGFNGLRLEPIVLSSNFRSDARLVDWVNRSLGPAFPQRDDIRTGEIRFSPAEPQRDALEQEPVSLAVFDHELGGRRAEAGWLAGQVEAGLDSDDCESIAILVRGRSHLLDIILELKARNIPWQAQDIDSLADSPVVRDLQTLCRALHNTADRVAWLALLRAPWCGLSLPDLQSVAAAAGSGTIPGALARTIPLSDAGQQRLARFRDALLPALALRERCGLRAWVEHTWLALQGPACVQDSRELDDAAAFLALLEARDNLGLAYDEAAVAESVSGLYAEGGPAGKVQLMTLHKAKGLEFDWVFIPGLDRLPPAETRELMLWDEYQDDSRGKLGFMMAVNDDATASEPTLYNYLHRMKVRKRKVEATRLLYVGATRAAKRLFLSATLNRDGEDWKAPGENALLYPIWDAFASRMQEGPPSTAAAGEDAGQFAVNFRLALRNEPEEAPSEPVAADSGPNLPERPVDSLPRHIGTVVHQVLQYLSGFDEVALSDMDPAGLEPWWQARLLSLGIAGERLEGASARVGESVRKVLADEKGRYILASNREQAASELPLSRLREDGSVQEFRVDRSFVDGGIRWVVDYKNSEPEAGESLAAFLARESGHYAEQLSTYRRLLSGVDGRPVRTALYFTALPLWHELPEP